MTSDANPDAFLALLTQSLITDAQHDAVLAHPETATLPPLPSPAHALAWMRVRGLISTEQQDAALEKLEAATPADPNLDDAQDTAIDADDLVELAERGITHEAVESLCKDGLIDTETRDMARRETPVVGTVPAAPATTLAWLVTEGLLEKETFDATRAQVATEPGFAMTAERQRIVAEAQVLIDADEQAVRTWRRQAQRTRRLGAWKFILGTLVVAGGLGWFFFAPGSVPACDAASTRKTLDSLMVRVAMDVRMRNLDPGSSSSIQTPSVGSMREVGYRKPERVRGCVALMKQGDSTESMAYTIGPRSPKSDEIVVRGADVAIVEARFGHLDASGKPLYNAEPIGREALEKAFREGAAPLSARSSSAKDVLRRHTESGLLTRDPDRSREIAEIELTGPCRPLESRTGQTCPLVVEYNDRLLGAIAGSGDTTLPVSGEFTFVQEDGTWRVGDDFPQTFTRKVLEARLSSLGVMDAAMPAFEPTPR
ncbi:hypothetical protein [Variovorax sp. PAMC26660]|uniref:hypothetical protein n=1 Tax=Variovorax sp. PAMC26660 TaxID=2762322 RepID=UPI00164D070D|nr:hypothetical protein [Variovorax sp. PAMC26660]QNK67591.1 hypothetical protein H7F35_31365 [Variovorax sp. PAMC26660]